MVAGRTWDCSWVDFIYLIIILHLTGTCGAAYRRGYSNYRSYYPSYRSSYYSYRPSSYARSPSLFTSRYVSYNPGLRYSRTYSTSRLGLPYIYYYSLYWGYGRTSAYSSHTAPSLHSSVCVNYEADDNGTALGIFVCPLPFEPDDYTQCCGDQYAEFCCKRSSSANVFLVVGLCCLIAGVVVIVAIFCYVRYRQSKRAKVGMVLAPPRGHGPPPQPGSRKPHQRPPPRRPGNPHTGGPFVVGSGSGMAAPYTHTGRGAPGNYPPPNYSSAHGHQMPPAYSQQGFGYGPVGPPGGGHPRSPAPPYSPNINGGLQGQPVPSGGAHSGTPDRGGTFYTDPPPYSLVVEEAPLNPPAAPSDTTLYPPSNNRNTLATPRPPIH